MKSYSQCGQDLYAFEKTNNKKDGYYIEIGAYDPVDTSNSYMLELIGWSGLSFEIRGMEGHWKGSRKNTLIRCDARHFDFKSCFQENNTPLEIDYLSLDIDEGSLDSLKILPLDTYRFKCITIEHDEYHRGSDMKNEMRRILYGYGYTLDRPDVANGGNIYEDWWIS